jgi:hypothetical protein
MRRGRGYFPSRDGLAKILVSKRNDEEHPCQRSGDESDDRCLEFLGTNGTWVQDWDYAKRYGQFSQPRFIGLGPFVKRTWGRFKPSADAPVAWETSWRWVDHTSESCQIDYTLDINQTCSLLAKLGVDRIFFLGDSLSNSQYSSLINKMGGHQRLANYTDFGGGVQECTLLCTGQNADIRTRGTREGGGKAFPHSKEVTPTYLSNRSREFLTSSPQRVLAVLNIGVHYHDMPTYQTGLAELFGLFDELARPDDLVFFRTTPSGHAECQPRNPRAFNFTEGIRITPWRHYSEFKPTSMHDWDKLDAYNRYIKDQLAERKNDGNASTTNIR